MSLGMEPASQAKNLNSKIIQTLATGAKIGSMIGPASSAVGGALSALTPVGIGLGLGALGYGGYKLYQKWKNRKRPLEVVQEEEIVDQNGRKIGIKDYLYSKGRDLYNTGAEWTDTKGRELLRKGKDWSVSTGRDLYTKGANWSNTRGRELLNEGLEKGKELISDSIKFAKL